MVLWLSWSLTWMMSLPTGATDLDIRILIAEDEALIAMQIEMDLEDAGYRVVGPYLSLPTCLEALKTERIDAAVLDVDLAGFDVFPVADQLQEAQTPFVFHTGRGSHERILARFPDAPICKKPAEVTNLLKQLNLPASIG